jgi:hypothetical protein
MQREVTYERSFAKLSRKEMIYLSKRYGVCVDMWLMVYSSSMISIT